jgi:hypothetical protein
MSMRRFDFQDLSMKTIIEILDVDYLSTEWIQNCTNSHYPHPLQQTLTATNKPGTHTTLQSGPPSNTSWTLKTPFHHFFLIRSAGIKGTQAWDNLDFFLPKSNPYLPFVNFRNKFRFFSFDFRQFDVWTFPRWLSISGTKFFLEISQNFFEQIFTLSY